MITFVTDEKYFAQNNTLCHLLIKQDCWIPLHWAVKLGKTDLVEFLITHGSVVDATFGKVFLTYFKQIKNINNVFRNVTSPSV